MRDGHYIIDAHHHVGNLARYMGTATASSSDSDAVVTPEIELHHRLETMDTNGVDQAVVLPMHGYLRPRGLEDTREVNDAIAAYRDARPDRFPAAVGIVEPLYGAAGLPELDRISDELGLVGVTFHVRMQGVPTNSRLIFNLIERMGELGLVPIVHALGQIVDESMLRIFDLANAFPDLTMVVLDAFSTFEQASEAIAVAGLAPNLVFDTSLCYQIRYIVQLVKRFGADRMIFGTDLYSYPTGYRRSSVLPQLLDSGLESEDLSKILSGNVQRIYRFAPSQ